MYGADWREVFGFEVTNGLEVLDSDALVVLGPAGVDATVRRSDGGERGLGPFGRLGGDGVQVGVEEERRERRVGAKPCEEEDGFVLVWSEVESLDLEVESFTLGSEEGNGGGVVWLWVGCVDLKVALEASDGGVLLLLFLGLG